MSASSGYVLNDVQVDGTYTGISGSTYTFDPITSNHTIVAVFKAGTGGTGGNGGQSGQSYISGCAAATYGNYNGSFNAADFTLANAAVSNGSIVLQTGNQAIDPNHIVIPYTQKVYVSFIYVNACYISDMGWLFYSDFFDSNNNQLTWDNIPLSKKHPIFIKVTDGPCGSTTGSGGGVGMDGIFDGGYGNGSFPYGGPESAVASYNDGTAYPFIVDGDGQVTPMDMKKSIGTIAGGSEIVFFLSANSRWNASNNGANVYFTKQALNPDTYGGCTPSGTTTFVKHFDLSQPNTATNCTATTVYGWLDAAALTRLSSLFGITFTNPSPVNITLTANQSFPRVIVGAPPNDPNQWILAFEDGNRGGDYDVNDLVFRIQRQTGGNAQLTSNNAISSADPNAYYTSVVFGVYDDMPCSGQTNITYYLSINNGASWTQISQWDTVNSCTDINGSITVGAPVSNWTPGSPEVTYRTRTVSFTGSAQSGNQLIWKAQLTSNVQTCAPSIINSSLSGTLASHGFFSLASPSILANVSYDGSYETPAATWTDNTFRGHVYATKLYDPANPGAQNITQLWDAGAQLGAVSPDSRSIYFPNVTATAVSNVTIGVGDGVTTTFSGTLAHHPITASTVSITDTTETLVDEHTNSLVGNMGGTGTINRFTGVYSFTFTTAPPQNVPVVASYTYYTTSSTLNSFMPGSSITTTMLALDNSTVTSTGGTSYVYDFNHDGVIDANDAAYLVDWVRGYADGTGKSQVKPWLLGAIDHSQVAIESPPGRPAWYYGTAVTEAQRTAYDTFFATQWQRKTVAFVGSMDGMIHAFDAGAFRWGDWTGTAGSAGSIFNWGINPADSTLTNYHGYFNWTGSTSATANYGTGNELWAFIPGNLMSRLKNNLLATDDQAAVDASPALSDVYINGQWRTVMLCAEGSGGDTVFCLDVTDPYNPTFLWEFADPDLYTSQSSPAVATVGQIYSNGASQWVAFFVSGQTYDTTMYPSIYMINVADGSVAQRIYLDAAVGNPGNCTTTNGTGGGAGGVPSGQPAVVDSDGNGYIDRLYIGTNKGYLYKITIPDNPGGASGYGITNCIINTDFTPNSSNGVTSIQQYNPIYGSPSVVAQNTYTTTGDIQYHIAVLFGTGANPFYSGTNTTDNTYDFFTYVDTAQKGDCYAGNVYLDWVYQLPAGQYDWTSAFSDAGNVYFGTSTSKNEDPCSGAGNPAYNAGQLFVMNISQTAGTTIAPVATLNTGNILSSPVVDDSHLYVNTIGNGLQTTAGQYNNPVLMSGIPAATISNWRQIIDYTESLVTGQ